MRHFIFCSACEGAYNNGGVWNDTFEMIKKYKHGIINSERQTGFNASMHEREAAVVSHGSLKFTPKSQDDSRGLAELIEKCKNMSRRETGSNIFNSDTVNRHVKKWMDG